MSRNRSDSVFVWLQKEVRPQVDEQIEIVLDQTEYPEPLQYQIKAGGKRIRPGLALLVGRLCSLQERQAMDIAVGIELLHTFTLVHDDIIDNDRRRRGQPSLWVEYGEDSAIIFGDILFAKSLQMFPEECRGRVIDSTIEMAEGQQIDVEFSDRRDLTVDEYIEMVNRKTGCLFDLCIEVPQDLADVNLGIDDYTSLWSAYQIRDDLLDLEPEKSSVEEANDIKIGKRSLPIIHADDQRIYDILDKPARNTTTTDVTEVRNKLADHGSIEFAQQKMQTYVERALNATENLPPSEEKHLMNDLCMFLINREI